MNVIPSYEEMLENAYRHIPKQTAAAERFEVPQADILYQGNQTIIKNFVEIAEKLRRPPAHLLRFLSKETATPAHQSERKAIFQARIPSKNIAVKLEAYVKIFVLCKECKRPDTKIIKKDRINIMKCEACGAETSVKTV